MNRTTGTGYAASVILGLAIGVGLHQLALGLVIGILLGAILSAARKRKTRGKIW